MPKSTKVIVWLIVIALAIWGFASLNKKPETATPASGEPVKIGVIAPLTGPVADYGEEIKKGVMAGLATGTEAVFEDDKCDPKEAVSAFKKLVDFQNLHFIIGPACGSPQEAIVPLLKNQHTIAIVPSAASAELYNQSSGNFYNIQYSLQDESKFIAEKMFELGYKKVALISYGNAFSQTHADSFRKNFLGDIAVDSRFLDDNADVSTEATKISAAKVDAIYSPDISFFFANGVNKLHERKVVAPIFSTYVAELPAARTLVPDVFYSFPADLTGSEGAVFELSKQATQLLSQAVRDCNSEYTCVKNKVDSSGEFDQNGTSQRAFILKQIKNNEPVTVSH